MADEEMKAPHPQCSEEICGRHQGRGCASCEALEERDRFEKPFWLLYNGTSALLRYTTRPFLLLFRLLEWGSEWLVSVFRRYVVLQILTAIPIIIGLIASGIDLLDRPQERILRAWQVIAASPDAQGNIGQREALGFLIKKGATVEHINLRNAYLSGINLSRVNLRGSNFHSAKMQKADLRGAQLGYADLSGAQLGYADLSGADFKGAQLDYADLRWADLRGADLYRTSFLGADLRGTDLREVDFGVVHLSEANLSEANLSEALNLSQGQLDKACADDTTKLPKGLSPMSSEHRKLCTELWSDSFKP